MHFYIILFLIQLEWRTILRFCMIYKFLLGILRTFVRGFCSFPRESTCISYQGTAEALQGQQCTQKSKRQRLRLWCLFFNPQVGNALCVLHSTQTQHEMTLRQSIRYQVRSLTYPSHCNAINKCHIWLLAGACKKCQGKQSFIFFKSAPVTSCHMTGFPTFYFSKNSRK